MKLALKCFTLLIITSAVELAEQTFSYKNPESWTKISATCGGSYQSPVNIPSHAVRLLGFRVHPKFVNYHQIPITFNVRNNGHSAQITGTWHAGETPKIIGDGIYLKGEYIFQQMHFHWGQNDSVGSEHTFDRKSMKVESHLVHMNSKYDSMDEAMKHHDGIIVIAHLYDISHIHDDLQPISKALWQITAPNSVQKLVPCSLNHLNVNLNHSYYSYHGSLTTPPCSEAVTWFINAVPLQISRTTLDAFRRIKLTGGDLQNVRPLQSLNDRVILRFVY